MRGVVGFGASVALHGLLVGIALAWLPAAEVRVVSPATDEVAFDVKQGTAAPGVSAAKPIPSGEIAGGPERVKKTRRPARPAAGAESVAATESVAANEAAPASESASESSSASPSASGSVAASDASRSAPDPAAIRSAIARVVRYPRLARSQGLEGQVTIRFHIDPSGAPSELIIVTSGGALLDAAARDAVLHAAPYRSPPGWVRVPVIFSLHDSP